MSWTPGTTHPILRSTPDWDVCTSVSSAWSTWRVRPSCADTWYEIRQNWSECAGIHVLSCWLNVFGLICLCRPSVYGNIPLVMRYTGKVPSLCLRSMERRTRYVMNLCVFDNTQLLEGFVIELFLLFNRSIARTCVCWPSCFWTIKHCIMMWSHSFFMSWLRLITPAVTWWDISQR